MSGWHILLLVVVIAFIYSAITPCIRVPYFQLELPVPTRPSLSRPDRNVSLGKRQSRFISNVDIKPLTDHNGWNGDALPCPVIIIIYSWFLEHLTINTFIFDFELLQALLLFLQTRQENAITWCTLVIVSSLLKIS